MTIRKYHPEDYDFFPKTFILPYEINQFKDEFRKKKPPPERQSPTAPVVIEDPAIILGEAATALLPDDTLKQPPASTKEGERESRRKPPVPSRFAEGRQKREKSKPNIEKKEEFEYKIFIVKPECESQGKGIFLTRTWEHKEIDLSYRMVAQHYIDPPYLIDGLKFDLRIYVLLYGINPMKIYLFEEGLARFATEPYEAPTKSNLGDVYMHLTNYAINKNNDNYVQNDNEQGEGDGHKRSLTQIYRDIVFQEGEKVGPQKVEKLQKEIKDIVIKTMITGQP